MRRIHGLVALLAATVAMLTCGAAGALAATLTKSGDTITYTAADGEDNDKEPEGYFDIPLSRLPGATRPTRVRPANGQPGGGLECTVSCPVDVRGLVFRETR